MPFGVVSYRGVLSWCGVVVSCRGLVVTFAVCVVFVLFSLVLSQTMDRSSDFESDFEVQNVNQVLFVLVLVRLVLSGPCCLTSFCVVLCCFILSCLVSDNRQVFRGVWLRGSACRPGLVCTFFDLLCLVRSLPYLCANLLCFVVLPLFVWCCFVFFFSSLGRMEGLKVIILQEGS